MTTVTCNICNESIEPNCEKIYNHLIYQHHWTEAQVTDYISEQLSRCDALIAIAQ